MVLSTDVLTYFFLVFCSAYNGFLLVSFLWFTVFQRYNRRGLRLKEVSLKGTYFPTITIIMPVLNEENVIKNSIKELLKSQYAGRFEILAVDDHSNDDTPAILSRLSKKEEHFYYFRRKKTRSRIGKGDVLNQGYEFLRHVKFPNRNPDNWIIGVFDADGRPVEGDLFTEVGKLFLDETVSAAQCGVRIRNQRKLISALQDVEFSTFSYITQTVRDRTSGAVALGGNGQFIRAAALDEIRNEGHYWNTSALTEDLEIGTKILIAGGRTRFVNRWISQEGVETFPALFKQRIRWAWGALQVFSAYVLGRRVISSNISWKRKLDLHYYLSFWIVPFVVLFTLMIFFFDQINLVTIKNGFGWKFLIINSFSFLPLIVTGLIKAEVNFVRIIYLTPISILYTYHWIPVLGIGLYKMVTKAKPYWMKTERYEVYVPDDDPSPDHVFTLGEILTDRGACSPKTIEKALEDQNANKENKKLGEILVDSYGLKKNDLDHALGMQKNLTKDTMDSDTVITERINSGEGTKRLSAEKPISGGKNEV